MSQTQTANYYAWRIGQKAYVRFGSKGTQLAECRGFNRSGQVIARKYRERSGTWTKNVVVREAEFLRFA